MPVGRNRLGDLGREGEGLIHGCNQVEKQGIDITGTCGACRFVVVQTKPHALLVPLIPQPQGEVGWGTGGGKLQKQVKIL